MAETANTVITDALQEILVLAVEAPLTPNEIQTGIRYLNRMMTAFAVEGINLGFTTITNIGDPITVADGAIEGMVSNLALKLAPQFGADISPALAAKARDGLAAMEAIAVTVFPTSFGSTLPIGSGNEDNFPTSDSHFYSGLSKGVLNEQGGFISVEAHTPLEEE